MESIRIIVFTVMSTASTLTYLTDTRATVSQEPITTDTRWVPHVTIKVSLFKKTITVIQNK